MLRRSKKVIVLPRRQDHRRFLKLSAQEQHAYNIAKQKAIQYLEDVLNSCKPQEGYKNALQKINVLRVICELGCSTQPVLHTALSNSVVNGSLLAPGTPDGISTPSTMMDDTEDDDCELERDDSSFDYISSRLQEFSPPCMIPRIGLNPVPKDPSAEFSLSSSKWPTKIQALVEDLQSCAAGVKRYV